MSSRLSAIWTISCWFGGAAGAVAAPILSFMLISNSRLLLLISIPEGFLLALTAGFIGSFVFSGLRGRGHNTGPSYMSGFGGGRSGAPPGGIILSDEERKHLKT